MSFEISLQKQQNIMTLNFEEKSEKNSIACFCEAFELTEILKLRDDISN